MARYKYSKKIKEEIENEIDKRKEKYVRKGLKHIEYGPIKNYFVELVPLVAEKISDVPKKYNFEFEYNPGAFSKKIPEDIEFHLMPSHYGKKFPKSKLEFKLFPTYMKVYQKPFPLGRGFLENFEKLLNSHVAKSYPFSNIHIWTTNNQERGPGDCSPRDNITKYNLVDIANSIAGAFNFYEKNITNFLENKNDIEEIITGYLKSMIVNI